MKNRTQISKLIALVLRHKPEVLGLQLDEHGWTDTATLIERINARQSFDMATLEEIVRTDEKQRYAFNEDKTKIRASQGHSLAVDLELKPQTPPHVLWHGTSVKNLDSIAREGLLPRGRHYVPLSSDPDTAHKVGSRHGGPFVIMVNATDMAKDGLPLYRSENGVWLADAVPAKYLLFCLP